MFAPIFCKNSDAAIQIKRHVNPTYCYKIPSERITRVCLVGLYEVRNIASVSVFNQILIETWVQRHVFARARTPRVSRERGKSMSRFSSTAPYVDRGFLTRPPSCNLGTFESNKVRLVRGRHVSDDHDVGRTARAMRRGE